MIAIYPRPQGIRGYCNCGVTGCPEVCLNIAKKTPRAKGIIQVKPKKKQWGKVNQWQKKDRFK